MRQCTVGKVALRRRKVAEAVRIPRAHLRRNIVKEQRHMRDAQIQELVEPVFKRFEIGCVRVLDL